MDKARSLARTAGLLGLGVTGGLILAAASGDGGARGLWPWALAIAGICFGAQFIASRAGGGAEQAQASGVGVAPSAVGRRSSRASGVAPASLAAVVAAFPEPCIAVDGDGAAIAMSSAAIALFPGAVQGRPLSFALRAPEFLAALEAVLAGGPARTVEVTQRAPVERRFEASVAPLDDGRWRGALVTLRDLTSQQRVEQMRVDFIANASHELRTPLASVLGFIETLQGPARDDAAARERFLSVMREQALRMKRLIDDLLSLSRIEGHLHQTPSDLVDLVDVASEIIESLRPMAEAAGVELNLAAPEKVAPVSGDRDELLRVVENLVENAVKYGGSGGRVDVAVEASAAGGPDGDGAGQTMSAGEVVISVRDYGPGVAAEHLPRLTERFYRVDPQHSRGKGGSGLGLAIVKHIVSRHRGRLHVESREGEGVRIRVALPAAAAAARPAGAA